MRKTKITEKDLETIERDKKLKLEANDPEDIEDQLYNYGYYVSYNEDNQTYYLISKFYFLVNVNDRGEYEQIYAGTFEDALYHELDDITDDPIGYAKEHNLKTFQDLIDNDFFCYPMQTYKLVTAEEFEKAKDVYYFRYIQRY